MFFPDPVSWRMEIARKNRKPVHEAEVLYRSMDVGGFS